MEYIHKNFLMSEAFEVLLRVPPIILMDVICMSDYVVSINGWAIVTHCLKVLMKLPLNIYSDKTMFPVFPSFESIAYYFIYHLGLVTSVILFLQKIQSLISFYFVIAAVGIVAWSYILNEEFIKFCTELLNVQHTNLLSEIFRFNTNALQIFICNYMYQTFLAIVFSFTTKSLPQFPQNRFLFGVLFVVPTIVAAPFPSLTPFPFAVSILPIVVAVITLFDLLYYISKFISNLLLFLKKYYVNISEFFRGSFDIIYSMNYLKTIWKLYKVKRTLQVFGIIRLLKNLVLILYDDAFFSESANDESLTMVVNQIQYVLHELAVRSCDNMIAILGVSSVTFIFIENCVWKPLQKLLLVPEDEQKSIFVLMTTTKVISALISGITNLKPDERSLVVLSISFLIRALFLYELHAVILKRLEVLSTAGNASFKKHSRALFCGLVILTTCIYDCIVYIDKYDVNQWIIRSVLCSLEIAVTLIISLIVYSLNMINMQTDYMWHDLHDYIYYLESAKSSFRFIIGFFIFVRGIISLSDNGSLIKLVFLSLHVYYNVCIQLSQGWQSWKSRRYVAKCVKALPEITEEEFADVEVCAICYEDISSHVVVGTRCNHFYHKSCLKRWLYNRRTCPMCHRSVIRDER